MLYIFPIVKHNSTPGYYQEYTVATPGVTMRGSRRLIVGQNGEMYYTEDHYNSFQEVLLQP
ncbi:MAG: hypothetical protein GDA48_26180 [Hormoscilla sp. GM102CHS1]|nr:hypothetical protein [Hormoscilla sp. GM102CHS1]